MGISRRVVFPLLVVLGFLCEPLLGCGGKALRIADGGAADTSAGSGGLRGTGGQAGTGGQTDAGPLAAGGSGGRGDAAGSAAGGAVAGGTSGGGTGGMDAPLPGTGGCAAYRMCDPGDQTIGFGYGYDDPSLCPAERECYYLQFSCGPTACVLRNGVHCNDPLVCDPGDYLLPRNATCSASTGQCQLKSLCGNNIICGHSLDGGATVDVAYDAAQTLDTAGDGEPPPLDLAACNPGAEYERSYVASSPALCATIRYTCPAKTTGFQNDCGCGCEQSAACPQYLDCMPGSGPGDPLCDTSSGDCPYTVRAF